MVTNDEAATNRDWSIHRKVTVDAPLETVWTCISTPELVSQWWCPPPTVAVSFDRAAGGRYDERYDDGEVSYDLSGTVEALEPMRQIVIRRETENAYGAEDRVTITLGGDDPPVTVSLEHAFPDIPDERREGAHEYYAEPWEHSLMLLGAVAENESTA